MRQKTTYKEKASLQSLLKIIKEIRLNWFDCVIFAVHSLLGIIILPLTFKLVIETLASLAYSLSFKYAEYLTPLFERFLYIFQYAQWPLFAVVIAVYWFRCNIKVYNYSFTRSVSADIRRQLAKSDTPLCPRCEKPMRVQEFTVKIWEKTGEHTEYYTEWVGSGADRFPVTQKETVADYSDVEHKRQYAICQNQYCMYKDKRPFKRAVAMYKFAEMPYKIADTINYAVRTKAKSNQAAGDITQYSRGLSLFGYLGICIAMLIVCELGNLSCVQFLNQQDAFYAFLNNLMITEGIVICCSAIFQIAVHIRYRTQTNDYVEINRTKDGATVVLPDGTEFHAVVDRRIQNMYDMMLNAQNTIEYPSEKDE